jgi:Ca2+/Na+ antiporter
LESIKRDRFKIFIALKVLVIFFVFYSLGIISLLLFENNPTLYVLSLILTLICTVVTAVILFKKNYKTQKSNTLVENALASLHDPDEVLAQTGKSEVLKWIKLFEKTGYIEIANNILYS